MPKFAIASVPLMAVLIGFATPSAAQSCPGDARCIYPPFETNVIYVRREPAQRLVRTYALDRTVFLHPARERVVHVWRRHRHRHARY